METLACCLVPAPREKAVVETKIQCVKEAMRN